MSCAQLLSALDPGKQGLKRTAANRPERQDRLSALDPGKQGLKLRSPNRFRMLFFPFSA